MRQSKSRPAHSLISHHSLICLHQSSCFRILALSINRWFNLTTRALDSHGCQTLPSAGLSRRSKRRINSCRSLSTSSLPTIWEPSREIGINSITSSSGVSEQLSVAPSVCSYGNVSFLTCICICFFSSKPFLNFLDIICNWLEHINSSLHKRIFHVGYEVFTVIWIVIISYVLLIDQNLTFFIFMSANGPRWVPGGKGSKESILMLLCCYATQSFSIILPSSRYELFSCAMHPRSKILAVAGFHFF